MKKNIVFKILSFLLIFHLFFIHINCQDSSVGPPGDSVNPFNGSFLFIEYRIYTYGEHGNDTIQINIERYNSCYSFDDSKYEIAIDTMYQKRIDTTNKFIMGSVALLGQTIGTGIVGVLKGYSSFDLVDSMSNPPFTYGHQIKMIECNKKGETKISFDNNVFTLKPKEKYQDTISRANIALQIKNRTYNYKYINDIIIIRNFGFIDKKNIRYY